VVPATDIAIEVEVDDSRESVETFFVYRPNHRDRVLDPLLPDAFE
jgi:hypothetical protein